MAKSDPLGKLIERYAPSHNKAALYTVAIAAVFFGFVAWGYALLGAGGTVRLVFIGVGVFGFLVGAACLALILLGPGSMAFAVHKKGVRFTTRKTDQYLLWEEIENIDIRRVTKVEGVRAATKYEVFLVGSETIHLTPSFLGSLDSPGALIKTLKKYSGKDFETVVD